MNLITLLIPLPHHRILQALLQPQMSQVILKVVRLLAQIVVQGLKILQALKGAQDLRNQAERTNLNKVHMTQQAVQRSRVLEA